MSKGLLIETHLFEAKLQQEENGTYLVKGILQRAGAPNQNHRRYLKYYSASQLSTGTIDVSTVNKILFRLQLIVEIM